MNPGTAGGGGITEVGDHGLFLTQSHVAHDCKIGSHVIFSNNVMMAGHCNVGDYAILSGGAGIHQFVRIGAHAFVGGLSGVENDVIPYGMALGNRAHLAGLNIIGLKRRGFDREQIHALRRAYRLLFANEGTLQERLEDVAQEFHDHPQVQEVVDFIRAGADRAICTPRNGVGADP
jgi:UDP-N-acetylglucosamine acyltransferase